MRRFLVRIFDFFSPNRAEHELQREMNAHLALLEDEYVRRGMSPDEAQLAARRTMGSLAHARDLHRDARSFAWIDDLRRDFRLAWRGIGRNPTFTIVALFALGLGIAVNTTFFTIVNAICLRGLPIDAPERVMYLSSRNAEDRPGNLSYAEFDDLRARATAFSQVAAYTITTAVVADAHQPPTGGVALLDGVYARRARARHGDGGMRAVCVRVWAAVSLACLESGCSRGAHRKWIDEHGASGAPMDCDAAGG